MELSQWTNYRKALELLSKNSKRIILKSHLAKAAQCSSSWITRVFAEEVQLTPDQMLGIAIFFKLNDFETDYLLALLEKERSSSSQMKIRIDIKLKRMKEESKELQISTNSTTNLSEEQTLKYYSSWYYAAIHVATMIKKMNVEELAEKFRLDSASASVILEDLKDMGLIELKLGDWSANNQNLHLAPSHKFSRLGHTNWRYQTIGHLQNPNSQGLHYSGPHSLSKSDFLKINEILKSSVIESRKVIENSPSECIAVLGLDWYLLE